MLVYQPQLKKRVNNIILTLSNKEPSSNYGKDDLWAISATPDFQKTVLYRSFFFGMGSQSKIELMPVGQKSHWPPKVYAIRLMNAHSEFSMLDILDTFALDSNYLTSILKRQRTMSGFKTPLRKPRPLLNVSPIMTQMMTSIIQEYHLNQDQEKYMYLT